MLVLPTSLNACERNQIVQVCERFISMMHLGELIWKVFFQSEHCFNRNSQACLKPYEDNTQLNNTLQILLFINLDQQPTVSAILGAVILHSDLRMDPLKIIGTPWMNLIPRLETVIRQSYQKKRKPAMGGSGGEKGADCRSFTFQLASLNFWNLNMTIFHRF